MKQWNYDVVVIGSGIGGICAAALLAYERYKTLLVEKTPILGGRCSTMEYKGFKLTTGAISLSPGAAVNQVFDRVGVDFDINTEPNVVYRVAGQDYKMPPRGGLRWLISHVSNDQAGTQRVLGALHKASTWQEPSASLSFHDWLLQYTQNEKIVAIFQSVIAALMVVNSWEVPANAVTRFLDVARRLRVGGFARRGNRSLLESLANVIRSKGGDVWTRCRVKQIIIANEAVSGVLVDREGEQLEVAAQAVISNAGPTKTVELAGKGNFDKGYLKDLSETIRPGTIVWVQTAINSPTFNHPGQLVLTGTRRVSTTVCPTFACPELAPEGKHLLLSASTPSSSLPPFDWKKEIELHIKDLSDNFPEFSKFGEILNAGCYWGEWPAFRTWPGYEMPQRTTVENLYNVGDAVAPTAMTGTVAAAESAKVVVEDVKKRVRPSL